MIRTKQLKLVDGEPKWVWGWSSREYQQGDRIHFSCNQQVISAWRNFRN